MLNLLPYAGGFSSAKTLRPPQTGELFFGAGKPYAERAQLMVEREGEKIGKASTDLFQAMWNFSTHTTKKTEARSVKAEHRLEERRRDRQAYEKLLRLMASPRYAKLDPVTTRALEVLKETYEEALPKPTDPPEFIPLKDEIADRTLALSGIVNAAPDRYKLGNTVPKGYDKPFSELLRDLVRDRNRLARMRGYDNYYSAVLAETHWDEKQFDGIIARLKPVVAELSNQVDYLYAQRQAQRYGLTRLVGRPAKQVEDAIWKLRRPAYLKEKDLTDTDRRNLETWKACKARDEVWTRENGFLIEDHLKGKNPVELLRKTAGRMGVPPRYIDEILEKSDLYPRRRKDPHWYASPNDPPFDVRVHTNITENSDELSDSDIETQLLHEVFGHGVDFKCIDPQLPKLLREQDRFSTEAFATMMQTSISSRTGSREFWVSSLRL